MQTSKSALALKTLVGSTLKNTILCGYPIKGLPTKCFEINVPKPKVSFASFHSSRKLRQEQEKQKEDKKAQEPKEETSEESSKEEKEEDQSKVIKELQEKVSKLHSELLYTMAERENMRRIGNEEVQKAKEFGIQSFAKSLLEVADTFSRCLESAKKEDLEANASYKTFYDGVELTDKIMTKVFKQHGLEKFAPLGQKFDPNTMNALSFMPDPSKESGTVGYIAKPGYILNKRVIRAPDVLIVKNETPKPPTEEKKEGSQ